MASFVGVGHAAQVAGARAEGIVAFSQGREAAMPRLAPGGRVACDAPKSHFDGDPVPAFVAVAEVTGEAPRHCTFPDGRTGWVRAARFLDATGAPVRPPLPELSFVTDRQYWGLSFRQGKLPISQEDFAIILHAIGGHP